MTSRAGSACSSSPAAGGLKSRVEPEERQLTLALAKIGELMMRLELGEWLIERLGPRTPAQARAIATRRAA